MPPGPADRPPSETLVTPGICYLPCQGIHKPEKSRQTTPGVKEPEKRKTHGAVRNEVVQVQLRRLEGHWKYTERSRGAGLCPCGALWSGQDRVLPAQVMKGWEGKGWQGLAFLIPNTGPDLSERSTSDPTHTAPVALVFDSLSLKLRGSCYICDTILGYRGEGKTYIRGCLLAIPQTSQEGCYLRALRLVHSSLSYYPETLLIHPSLHPRPCSKFAL